MNRRANYMAAVALLSALSVCGCRTRHDISAEPAATHTPSDSSRAVALAIAAFMRLNEDTVSRRAAQVTRDTAGFLIHLVLQNRGLGGGGLVRVTNSGNVIILERYQ
jgi:hypothetical protein